MTGMTLTHEERLRLLEEKVARLEQMLSTGKPVQSTKKRAAQIPADWQPKPAAVAVLSKACPNLDIAHETDSFRDYWTSRGEARADWDAAFRNWIRKAAAYQLRQPVSIRPQSRTAAIGAANDQRVSGALDRLAQVRPKTSA